MIGLAVIFGFPNREFCWRPGDYLAESAARQVGDTYFATGELQNVASGHLVAEPLEPQAAKGVNGSVLFCGTFLSW